MLIGKFNIILILDFACIALTVYFCCCSPIRSLIESGFDAGKRSDVRLYYGNRNLQTMGYQVISIVFFILMKGKVELLLIRTALIAILFYVIG